MAGPTIIVFGAVPLLVFLGLVAALGAGRRRATRLIFDGDAYPGLVALRRTTIRFRWVGIVAGLVAGIAVIPLGRLSPLAFAAPLVTGLVAVVVILLGQQLSYTKARSHGSAGLETRRVRAYLPRGLARWVGGATAALLTVCLFTTLAASPDDMGRPGRSLQAAWFERVYEAGTGGVIQPTDVPHMGTAGPFPGSFYTLAAVIALALLLVIATMGLVLTARRPRNGADPELVRVDDALRRITAEGIVAATGAGVAGAVLAVTAVAYPRFGGFSAVPIYVAVSYLFAVIALGALALTLAFIVTLLVPGNGEPR